MTTIYVVEMWCPTVSLWLPTCGVGLSPADGHQELWEWRRKNPDDTFRLRQYNSTGPDCLDIYSEN
jgi:hypothetical protein